jgi:hypothetical protein
MPVWFVRPFWPPGHGEKLLLAAIFRRAAFDIALYKNSQRIQQRRLAVEAYNWLMSDEESHFTSFVSICNILDQNPKDLRNRTLRLRREDVKKFDWVN